MVIEARGRRAKGLGEKRSERPAFDLSKVDVDGFARELQALRRETLAALGDEDIAHLRKIERWGRLATAIGLATSWAGPNLVSALGLGLGRSTRWLFMHHVGHRGYDRVPNVPPRYTSQVFARGARRFVDWPDWMTPEAWIYEHNVLHHSHTGEERDPDLIERNAAWLRASAMPGWAKRASIHALGLVWKPFYYAPNTLEAYMSRHTTAEEERAESVGWALWKRCYLPYAALNFGALPLAFLPLGPFAMLSALANSLLAELLTNAHTFLVVGPNHTGGDLYRFEDKPRSKAEGLVRQVIGSVNYACGNDLVDFAHLWLNYQIEHHLFPDVPMRRYRDLQPRVREICARYGVPYVQENVFERFRKMVDVAVGDATMRVLERNDASAEAAGAPAQA